MIYTLSKNNTEIRNKLESLGYKYAMSWPPKDDEQLNQLIVVDNNIQHYYIWNSLKRFLDNLEVLKKEFKVQLPLIHHCKDNEKLFFKLSSLKSNASLSLIRRIIKNFS